jgi:hypothetical protein
MLLAGLMRNVAITGNADSINAWYGRTDAGRWAARTAAASMPTRTSEASKGQSLRTLNDLRERGVVSEEEYKHLRSRARL